MERYGKADERRLVNDYRYMSLTADWKNDCEVRLLSFLNGMMWYHYGDKYSGVCIEIDIDKFQDKLKKDNIKLIKHGLIKYQDGVSHVDNQNIVEFLMEKRCCWASENEYRFLFPASITEIHIFNHCISGIYLGPKIETEKVFEFIDKFNPSCEIYHMRVDKYDGRLNRYPINSAQLIECN